MHGFSKKCFIFFTRKDLDVHLNKDTRDGKIE